MSTLKLDATSHDAIDEYHQWSQKATTDGGSGSSHRCQVTSGSSTTLTISTKTYTEIQAMGMMVVGAWVRKSRYGDGITFGWFLVSLFCSALLWISARYKWHRHGFLPPANGGGVSLCTGSAERSPLSCIDRLWDLWVHTIAYVGWMVSFFVSLFFPFLLYGLCSPGGLRLKRGIM